MLFICGQLEQALRPTQIGSICLKLTQRERREASREEDLLPLYVYASAHYIPSGEQGPIILPTTIGVELLAIIAMIAIAVGLPPVEGHQGKA